MASGMGPSSVKKKKPRKTKGKDNDDESVVGGRGASASAAGKRRASREQTADASDDGADEPTTLEASAERKAERALREQRQRVLVANHFDDMQFRRYEAWRAIKLPAATVRRVCYSCPLKLAELIDLDCQPDTFAISSLASDCSSSGCSEAICGRHDRGREKGAIAMVGGNWRVPDWSPKSPCRRRWTDPEGVETRTITPGSLERGVEETHAGE